MKAEGLQIRSIGRGEYDFWDSRKFYGASANRLHVPRSYDVYKQSTADLDLRLVIMTSKRQRLSGLEEVVKMLIILYANSRQH